MGCVLCVQGMDHCHGLEVTCDCGGTLVVTCREGLCDGSTLHLMGLSCGLLAGAHP